MEEPNFNNHNVGAVRSPTLRDLLVIAFRHRRLMVLSFLGILLGTILAAVLQSNRYEAGTKILVKRERVDPIVTSEASALPQFAVGVTEEDLNSEVELLKSRDLLENVVRACDLQNLSNSAISRVLAAIRLRRESGTPDEDNSIARAVRTLEKKLSVEVVKKTNLIAVKYESPDPELAARVLSALTNLYLEKHLAVHRPPGAFDFFQQETKRSGQGLSDAETRLVNFTRGGAAVSAKLEKEVALQKLAEFDGSLKQTQAAIAESQQRIRVLQEQAVSIPSRMVTQERNTDDGLLLSQLRANLLTLELKRTELLANFEPTYRTVQETEAQIAQTRAALAVAEKSQLHEKTTDRDPTHDWSREELAKAKVDLAGLQARAEATALTVRSYRENARSLEQKEVVQDDLIRSVKASEDSYVLYLRKEEEARISDALDRRRIINVAIAEAATVPSLPSNQRSLTLLVGLLLATVTSLGLALVAEQLDPTFRTPDEVSSFLGIPVLATMPQNGKNGKNGVPTHVPEIL
ncbi:MAG: Wzz/FepE/Etk N-terminal domain-containing protein [Candidatus Acidiferrales bacterium]